jgi:DNA helicase-2/ATP-dependent DNA helicase PcrA
MPAAIDGLLTPATFLSLVDEVLIAAGRSRLQAEAKAIVEVKPDDRVLQILAGPGSGKTEMLVWRVLYELIVLGTPPQRVMVTTFTRKAAAELEVRLVERTDALVHLAAQSGLQVMDPRVHDLRMGTIHSLCDALLAEYDVGYMENGIQLLDEMEATVRLLQVYPYKLGYGSPGRPPRTINRLIDREPLTALFRAPWDINGFWPGNNMQRVHYVSALLAQHTETWIPRCGESKVPNGAEVVHKLRGLTDDLNTLRERWSAYLDEHQLIDFATLQLLFFQRQTAVVEQLHHVFVDEFQDTNPIQYAIHTRWLDAPDLKLTVVGDDDQSMYRFRGSDIECFHQLPEHCRAVGVPYRIEKLETNWRSTSSIVAFSQDFKATSVLKSVSMPKTISAADSASTGTRVRILRGPWDTLCDVVAREIRDRASADPTRDPDTGLLFFSTSEKGSKTLGSSAPARLREAIEVTGMRVYNARNKTAGREGPVAELIGLLSYLIDPVDYQPVGVNGRLVMVCASDPVRAKTARTAPPQFPVNVGHKQFQTRFMKADDGDIGAPAGDRRELVEYVDQIREALAKAYAEGKKPRLTLTGLVARLLSFPRYRNSGYTERLFRQALFTHVLESTVAPTRRTRTSLDSPLVVRKIKRKYVWEDQYWRFLSWFGSMLSETDLDDPDVEAFEEGAVRMLTFHQAKGLEFAHVYIGGTGRDTAPHSVLQTMLFSGKTPKYVVDAGQPQTRDRSVMKLAAADRDRELYVAMTRAKKTLTFLWDPKSKAPLMALHPILATLFKSAPRRRHDKARDVEILEYCQ